MAVARAVAVEGGGEGGGGEGGGVGGGEGGGGDGGGGEGGGGEGGGGEGGGDGGGRARRVASATAAMEGVPAVPARAVVMEVAAMGVVA